MNFSQLMSLASGHVEARIVQTAVELGIFAALEASPSSAAAIATSRKLNPQATELLLNALTSLQLLNKHSETFSLADISKRFLLLSSANYVGDMIRFESSLWHCWEKLPEAICSGKPARSANMYQDDSNETAIFINAMDSLVKARGDAEIIANTLNWDEVGELLDVGSGPATYPIALCQKFGHLHATIFDLPATLNLTRRFVRQAGIEDRVHLIAGDYRKDTIPGNYDVIFLSNIIHGEGYAKNESLIRKLTNNLKLSGRMVIKDHILDDSRANPAVGAIFSLLMLLTTDGGRCYSFSEIESWMKQSGLSRVEQINLPSPLTSSLVIGAK
jgi:cyclopropane fatty-acyl-phospholipid synthase-like methyltransferase